MPPPLLLFEGDGRGKFKDIGAKTNLDMYRGLFNGISLADFDLDGDLDVYLTSTVSLSVGSAVEMKLRLLYLGLLCIIHTGVNVYIL